MMLLVFLVLYIYVLGKPDSLSLQFMLGAIEQPIHYQVSNLLITN